MPWIICAAAALFALAYLGDWRRFKTSTWKAVPIAIALQLATDWAGGQLGLYKVSNVIIPLFGSSAFFTLGHIFAVTILFIQYYPRDRWLQAAHIVVWSVLALTEEINLMDAGVLHYLNWGHHYSLVLNILAFTFIAWGARLVGAMDDGIKL